MIWETIQWACAIAILIVVVVVILTLAIVAFYISVYLSEWIINRLFGE